MKWMRVLLSIGALGALGALVWMWRPDAERIERGRSPSDQVREPVIEPVPELRPGPDRASPARGPPVVADAPEVPAGTTVSGHVLGPDGNPVRRSHVKFVWDDDGRKREQHRWVELDGSFTIDVDDPGARGDLLAYVHEHRLAPVALVGIPAGASELVLRLGPPSYFDLEVRDTRGAPVTVPCSPKLSWRLAGHDVEDDARGVEIGPMRFASSPVPFSMSVSPNGYERTTFGPGDPASVGSRLVVEVQSLPRVRGRVVQDGEPAPGVEVEMWELASSASSWPYRANRARADELGRFDLYCVSAGIYELRVFDQERGGGTFGPLELDAQRDVDGLELELTTTPGAIEGSVRFPEGHGPADVWLFTTCGHGLRSLRADGTFRLPGLAPGPCGLEVTESWEGTGGEDEWIRIPGGRALAPSWLAFHTVHEVEVRPGETTHLEIDLAGGAHCRLVGRILFDGAPPGLSGWKLTFAWLSDEATLRRRAFAHLNPYGEFEIGVQDEGEYRLELLFSDVTDARWSIDDRVVLAAGPTSWALDLSSGSLRIQPEKPGTPHDIRPSARWRGPGELRIEIMEPGREELGSFFFPFVPVGRVELRRSDERVPETDSSDVLECEIRAGETTEVRWLR